MKVKRKRLLAMVLVLCLSASLLAVPALAAEDVPVEPGTGTLPVQYFSSTLYNWDEAGANAATAAADYKTNGYASGKPTIAEIQSGTYYLDEALTQRVFVDSSETSEGGYTPVTVSYSSVCTNYAGSYTATDYFYTPDNGANYYPVYYTRVKWYILYYKNGNSYTRFGRTDTGSETVTLYTYSASTTTYWLEDASGNKVEGDTTYTSTGSSVGTTLYYASTDGAYEGKGFYFTDTASGKPSDAYVPAFSKWVGGNAKTSSDASTSPAMQNWHIYSGLAQQTLSESTNAPFNNETVNAAPLFATDDTATTSSWKSVYEDVDVPYVYDASTGYYELNSDKNAVYFDGGVVFGAELTADNDADTTKDGIQMSIADKPAAFNAANVPLGTGFQPFEDVSTSTTTEAQLSTSTSKTTAYWLADGQGTNAATFGFGMVTEVKFQMTDDGKNQLTGDAIEFSFSGDDDVWVYVDGELILDIGGTHDAIVGTINFATGAVTLTAPAYGVIGDKAVDVVNGTWTCVSNGVSTDSATLVQHTNLYSEVWGTTLAGFASQGEHTLTIYYMDRGQGRTNCQIKFNLPQRDTVEVSKVLTQSKDSNGDISSLTGDEQTRMNNVEFTFKLYEVNAKGEPVVMASTPFYILAPDGTKTSSTTGMDGSFTLKNGYTARFLVDIQTNSQYYVVEEAKDGFLTPAYTYTTNIKGTTATEANGLTSMTVTASGSDTAADKITFICMNYLDAALPNPTILPADDQIVIDYGLPIQISGTELLSNDTKRGDSFALVGLGQLISSSTAAAENGDKSDGVLNSNGTYTITTVSNSTTTTATYELISGTATAGYGTAAWDGDDTITYTLTKPLDGIETLCYIASATGKDTDESVEKTTYGVGQIKIIPATSMYYEENFGGTAMQSVTDSGLNYKRYGDNGLVYYSDYTIPWEAQNDSSGNIAYQETGYVGKGLSTYGSDPAYLKNLGDSNGTSMAASCTTTGAFFEYDFTGTGTAIYGRISTTSAYIEVKVTDEDGAVWDKQYIDTVVQGDIAGSKTLYDIPIYLNNELDYGTYHVRVYVYKQGTPTTSEAGASSPDFYLDGIRVYNPLGWENTEANNAYAADSEANTAVMNIRAKVMADNEIGAIEDSVFTLTDKWGENLTGNLTELADYAQFGPNNEFYLNDSAYKVSFALIGWDSTQYNLYLGMKAPSGASGVKVTVGSTTYTLNNSADCYYNISSDLIVKDIELANGETVKAAIVSISGDSGLVSLTNLKVTGTDEFNLAYNVDIEEDTEEYGVSVLRMVPVAYVMSLMSDEPEEGGEEPAEEEFFVPEAMDVEVDYAQRKGTVTITVRTSKDVAELTVNGETVRAKRSRTGYVFTYTEKNVAPGSVYDIVAYDADGLASEAYTVTAGEAPGEFQPELDIDVTYFALRRRATIVVTTTDEVAEITVNGETVRGKVSKNAYVFTYTAKYVTEGMAFEVVAYSQDGAASETYTVYAE